MSGLKDTILNALLWRRQREYDHRMKVLGDSYDRFLKEQEKELELRRSNMDKPYLSHTVCDMEKGISFSKEEIIIYASETGMLSSIAEDEICRAFEKEPEAVFLYADEDEVDASAKEWEEYRNQEIPILRRKNPRIKPIYSPETLISYNYPGNIVAFRSSFLNSCDANEGEEIYLFLLRNIKKLKKENVIHLPLILFHKRCGEEGFLTEGNVDSKEKELKKAGLEVSFLEGKDIPKYYSETDKKRKYPVYCLPDDIGISVIIPSKDNPEVLLRLLDSLKKDSIRKEIIVVDNGSNETNKRLIASVCESNGYKYLYEEREFNYSRMNNLGVKEAKEDILLLLNDDMEMITSDALTRMAGQLMQQGVGAVGAKLLYPNGSLIQHIGISNAIDGPVHKFIGKNDKEILGAGRNRFIHNCIGVTGACLMIRKADYEAASGLNEELRVAYNDADLCFKIIESGKTCVLRTDVMFYHYESLSRGADVLSLEKLERLAKEKVVLYQNHPDFYREDPYEGVANAGGIELGFDLENRFEKKAPQDKAKEINEDFSKCARGMVIYFDRFEKEKILRCDGEEFYVLQGHRLIPGIDNARYDFYLILKGQEKTYSLPMPGYLRKSIDGAYPNTPNTGLSGFCNYITESEIPKGTYEVGIYAYDCLKRNPVYQDSYRSITI